MDLDEEGWQKQAFAQARVFFYDVQKEGFDLSHEERRKILQDAIVGASTHVNRLRVFQRTIDGFKIFAFLGYEFARWIADTSTHGEALEVNDPARVASLLGIRRLNTLLGIQTNSATKLADGDETYVAMMLYGEITGNADIGVGANGLAAMFSMLSRYGKCEPDLTSI